MSLHTRFLFPPAMSPDELSAGLTQLLRSGMEQERFRSDDGHRLLRFSGEIRIGANDAYPAAVDVDPAGEPEGTDARVESVFPLIRPCKIASCMGKVLDISSITAKLRVVPGQNLIGTSFRVQRDDPRDPGQAERPFGRR